MLRTIAFYLPQYHPIPENDAWWGPGFTEWTNVAKARPRFLGHHQPHIPGELGYYDLRLPETRRDQAVLAQAHGIDAFAYYHYWFDGRMLLERPFDEVLRSREPEHRFCLNWANENWTRTWGGEERQVLMGQDHAAYDADAHMEWLARAFDDPRYIRVNGKPLWMVYVASNLPDPARTIAEWQRGAERRGLGGLYICNVLGPRPIDPTQARAYGFDASIEFYPRFDKADYKLANLLYLPNRAWNVLADRVDGENKRLPRAPSVTRLDYGRQVRFATERRYDPAANVHPAVFPTWDNSARRRYRANVYQNDDAALYGRWVEHAARVAAKKPADEQLLFVNAWNEWAEGCHLEPDRRHGRAFLEATRDALARARD